MEPADREQRAWPVWIAVGVGAVLLHLLQFELLPFALAAVIGFVTDPTIRWLCRRTGAPRWAVASGLYVALAVAVGALAILVGWAAARDIAGMAGSGLQPLRSDLQQVLGPKGVTLFGQPITADAMVDFLQAQVHRFLNAATLLRAGRPAVEGSIGVVLLVFLAFYAMVSGPTLVQGALWLVPPSRRPAVERVLPAMTRATQRYFIGVVVVVVFTALAAWIGYGPVLHVRNALVLSVAIGFLETVPAVGPALSAVLVGLAALQLHSLAGAAVMIAYALALRLTIDDILAPIVLGRSVLVHPVVVMLAYLVGAVLFGVTGLLLAVPAAACLRIALRSAYGEELSGPPRRRRGA
jgi:predicted PurR-regulated permease PerM